MPDTASGGPIRSPGASANSGSQADSESKKGTILLIGATGFIGRHIQTRLFEQGWRIRALVRSDSPRIDQVDSRVEIVDGTLMDSAALSRSAAGTTAVINCAGTVRGNCFEDFEAANVDGVQKLCDALSRLSKPPFLLHLSSLAATRPELSDYAQSKHAGEQVLTRYDALNWCVIRPPAVYGPGDVEMRATLGWVRRGFVPVAGGDRSQRLSMLHVDDLARAVLAWLAAPEENQHRCFAIDDGARGESARGQTQIEACGGYDWEALAAQISQRKPVFISLPTALMLFVAQINEWLARITGRKVMLSRGKVRELTYPRWVAEDNAAFRETTGWTPQISLAEGVRGLFES